MSTTKYCKKKYTDIKATSIGPPVHTSQADCSSKKNVNQMEGGVPAPLALLHPLKSCSPECCGTGRHVGWVGGLQRVVEFPKPGSGVLCKWELCSFAVSLLNLRSCSLPLAAPLHPVSPCIWQSPHLHERLLGWWYRVLQWRKKGEECPLPQTSFHVHFFWCILISPSFYTGLLLGPLSSQRRPSELVVFSQDLNCSLS